MPLKHFHLLSCNCQKPFGVWSNPFQFNSVCFGFWSCWKMKVFPSRKYLQSLQWFPPGMPCKLERHPSSCQLWPASLSPQSHKEEKHPHSMMLPPLHFNAGDGLCFGHTKHLPCRPEILVGLSYKSSFIHMTCKLTHLITSFLQW